MWRSMVSIAVALRRLPLSNCPTVTSVATEHGFGGALLSCGRQLRHNTGRKAASNLSLPSADCISDDHVTVLLHIEAVVSRKHQKS